MRTAFSEETFHFLRDLDANNSKEWFEANRDRYEAHWKAPALAFIEALAEPMAALDPALKADARINGSLRRINRDVRFSKDKSPYNARLHMVFWSGDHPNRSVGMHIVLDPVGVGYGTGLFGLSPGQLGRYRDMVMDKVERKALLTALDAAEAAGCTLGEPELQRLPKGVEAEGRAAELLRYKSVIARTRGTEARPEVVMGEGATDWAMAQTRALLPLMRWMALI